MKAYFQRHFTSDTINEIPIELIEAPEFLQALQAISTEDIKVGPPDESEILYIIKKLKDGKSTNDVPSTFIKKYSGLSRIHKRNTETLCNNLGDLIDTSRLGTLKIDNSVERPHKRKD